jgi:cystathionine gamma-synthase
LTIDDTIASFANIDLLPVADVIMSSTTKAFSGYANVMGGSLALPPSSTFYTQLQPLFTTEFHNEVFVADAEKLVSNSEDFLPRSTTLNRNALLLATYLHKQIEDESTGIKKVLYPPFTDTRENYEAFLRPATEEFTPGYGCLFSVEFGTLEDAILFYNNLNVHQGGHLGAHLTLALPFNALVLGGDKAAEEYHEAYGAKMSQVRVSVGLEDEETLVDTFRFAVDKVRESKRT